MALAGGFSLCLTACETYKTFDTTKGKTSWNGKTLPEGEASGRSGLHYFLPKGLIHVVVAPVGQLPADDAGLQSIPYTITADSVMVPDYSVGPFLAEYQANPFYSEHAELSTTKGGLLTASKTTSTDKTPAVISNLLEAATEAGKLAVMYGAVKNTGENKGSTAPRVRYKRLNVDVVFDPLDPVQRANFCAIFNSTVVRNSAQSQVTLISPFSVSISMAHQGRRYASRVPAANGGLYFRDLMPVTLQFNQNSGEFRGAINKVMSAAANHVKECEDAKRASIQNQNDLLAKQSLLAKQAPAPQAGATPVPTAEERLLSDQITEASEKVEDDRAKLAEAKANLKSLMATADNTSVSRTTNLTVAIPDPERSFVYNVARSGFVENKITNLTIVDGVLTSIDLTKPSEAEGISKIPLAVLKTITAMPGQLMTFKVENNTKEKELTTSEKDLAVAQAELLKSQLALEQAKAEKEAAERALKEAQEKPSTPKTGH